MKSGKNKSGDMAYKEAIDFLYNSLPMYQRDGGIAMKPGLENTLKLLKVLGNPHKNLKTIHVAGTNGKGSVSHMLCAAFMQSGYKMGLYTSPHLLDYRERIRVDGKKIKKKSVVKFVNQILPMCKELKPSFFEITVAMAFYYFDKKKVDIAIIETGLGGRLDSTNVIIPELSVITNIGMDHMQTLGDTMEKIAFEKAGIIKNKVPVVIGESHEQTKPVFENMAKDKGAKLFFADTCYAVKGESHEALCQRFTLFKNGKVVEKELETDLKGCYQSKNLVTYFMVVDVLRNTGFKIKTKNAFKALKKVKPNTGLMGRWDIVKHEPLVILDTAHNVEGFRELARQLEKTRHRKLYVIFGSVNDKDIDGIFRTLPSEAFYLFTKISLPRSMEVKELFAKANQYSYKGITCANINIAYAYAMNMARKEDMVLITGSNFIVADAMKDLGLNILSD